MAKRGRRNRRGRSRGRRRSRPRVTLPTVLLSLLVAGLTAGFWRSADGHRSLAFFTGLMMLAVAAVVIAKLRSGQRISRRSSLALGLGGALVVVFGGHPPTTPIAGMLAERPAQIVVAGAGIFAMILLVRAGQRFFSR